MAPGWPPGSTGLPTSRIRSLQDIFLYKQTGFDSDGRVQGYHEATGNIPKFVHALRRRGIDVDMNIFAKRKPAGDKKETGRRRRR